MAGRSAGSCAPPVSATPILMLTALDSLDDRVRGLRIGADDYLAKPFAFEELVARVQALARRGPVYRGEPTSYRVHDLVLDRATREVRRGERLIELTPREFALLECLMRAPGKVLSRALILEKVWGCSKHPLTNVVDVYIRQLRRKVDRDAPAALIQTVRGFGYKLRNARPTDTPLLGCGPDVRGAAPERDDRLAHSRWQLDSGSS